MQNPRTYVGVRKRMRSDSKLRPATHTLTACSKCTACSKRTAHCVERCNSALNAIVELGVMWLEAMWHHTVPSSYEPRQLSSMTYYQLAGLGVPLMRARLLW